jgi:hypothetical protein
MHSATTYVIRDIRPADVAELARLGWDRVESWPSGRILVGEIHGVVGAALAIDEHRAVRSDIAGSARLLAHMRARAAGIRGHRRTPSVADRIRERMTARRVAFS